MAKRKGKTRVRNYDLIARVEWVKEKLLSGLSRHGLIAAIKSEYKIDRTQAYKYVAKAEVAIREVVEQDRPTWLAYHVALRRDLQRRANALHDLSMELRAAESEAKLLGLDIAQVHVTADLTAKVAQTIDLTALTDEQLDALQLIVRAATTSSVPAES